MKVGVRPYARKPSGPRSPVRTETARREAENLVERFGANTAPVDVNKIAKALGLQIVYSELGENVSGLLVTRDGTSAICVRETDALVRQRFTIAHEIGHFRLRHQFEAGEHVHVDEGWKVTARSNNRTVGADPKEVEANQFAASLLMPTKLLNQRVSRFGIGRLDDDHVAELAREFKVSEQAMALRLAALGL
jgi:Zn-dependent peptidase ImmA (M78 family)